MMSDTVDEPGSGEGFDAGPPTGAMPREVRRIPQAWRLTFTYGTAGIQLVSQQRLEMIAPPDDSPDTYAARAGTWVEIRDAGGHGLYRQILEDPVRSGYENHSPDPELGSRRARRVSPPSGAFSVVVPDLATAHDVVLHRVPDTAFARGATGDTVVAEPVLTELLVETGPFEVT